MRLFLKQDTSEEGSCFVILNESGEICFWVTGEPAFGGTVLYLLNREGVQLARIRQYAMQPYCFSVITAGEGESATLLQNPAGGKALLKVSRKNWRLRGDIIARCFDLVDASGQALMIHGRCWEHRGDVYEINLNEERDGVLCLSIAVCIDYIASCGGKTVVAIN